MNLEQILTFAYPAVIKILFWCWLVSLMLNLPVLFGGIKRLKPWVLFGLLAIFALGLGLRLFYVPQMPQVFSDELNFFELSRHLAQEQRALITDGFGAEIYIPVPLGWEYLLSCLFTVFTPRPQIAFYFNALLSGLTVFPLFYLTGFLYKNERVGLWAALIYSLLPVALRISGSAALEPVTLFFWLLALGAVVAYGESPGWQGKAFCCFTVLYLLNLRQESFFFFFPVILGFWWLFKEKPVNRKNLSNYIWLGLSFYFVLPYFLTIIQGLKTGFYYFHEPAQLRRLHIQQNLIYNWLFWFDNRINPLFVTLLAGLGAVCGRKAKRALCFLAAWFFGGYIFYSLNPSVDFSLKHSLDSWRMALYLYPPLIIWAALGVDWLYARLGKAGLAMVLLVLLTMPWNYRTFIFQKTHLMQIYAFMAQNRPQLSANSLVLVEGDRDFSPEFLALCGRWGFGRETGILPKAEELHKIASSGKVLYLLTFKPMLDEQGGVLLSEGESLPNEKKPLFYRFKNK